MNTSASDNLYSEFAEANHMEETILSTEEFLAGLIEGHRQLAKNAEERIHFLLESSVEEDSIEIFATIFEDLVRTKSTAERAARSLEKELIKKQSKKPILD
ncbi:MAG: hypothetical protein HY326_07795 [Chloroflexi bacterium]|nr:hypothetical protein [Chloroflexota bacterium]